VSDYALDHGSTRLGRWLRGRRVRIALWIAAIEAILVAVFNDVSKWTVFAVAIVSVALYYFAGRNSRNDSFRHITWILAVSQLLATIAAILAFLVIWAVIIAVVVFAIVALYFVFTDRR
jgi:hypothetical protein